MKEVCHEFEKKIKQICCARDCLSRKQKLQTVGSPQKYFEKQGRGKRLKRIQRHLWKAMDKFKGGRHMHTAQVVFKPNN